MYFVYFNYHIRMAGHFGGEFIGSFESNPSIFQPPRYTKHRRTTVLSVKSVKYPKLSIIFQIFFPPKFPALQYIHVYMFHMCILFILHNNLVTYDYKQLWFDYHVYTYTYTYIRMKQEGVFVTFIMEREFIAEEDLRVETFKSLFPEYKCC